MSMALMIFGGSQLKYLDKYFDNIITICFSGARVQDMMKLIEDNVVDQEMIALHVGTNNITDEDVEIVLCHYQELLNYIFTKRPDIKVTVSGVLPRLPSRYQSPKYSEQEKTRFNRLINDKVKKFNFQLEDLLSKSYCGNTQFINHSAFDIRFLSHDGLHLNHRGQQYLGKVIIDSLKMFTINQVIGAHNVVLNEKKYPLLVKSVAAHNSITTHCTKRECPTPNKESGTDETEGIIEKVPFLNLHISDPKASDCHAAMCHTASPEAGVDSMALSTSSNAPNDMDSGLINL